jgi:beta-glucosidase
MSELGKGYNVKLRVEAEPEEVSQADVVILCVGFNKDLEYEAADRTYALPKEQVELINRVLDWNDNVVVVINSGGEVDLNGWGDKAEAIVMDWYAGQEGGRALAQLLSGRVSFSGRLPFTYWGSLEKNPAQQYYPVSVVDRAGERHRKSPCVEYREGVFVGYRGVEFFDSKPLYPFGYGLTYSDFQYSDIQVQECDEGYDVTFTIKNIGSFEAAEVAQVYVAPINPCVVRPARELKGFSKINLKKGESQQVTVSLPMEAFSRYDIDAHSWVMDKGEYIIQVGASSQDIRLQSSIEL